MNSCVAGFIVGAREIKFWPPVRLQYRQLATVLVKFPNCFLFSTKYTFVVLISILGPFKLLSINYPRAVYV